MWEQKNRSQFTVIGISYRPQVILLAFRVGTFGRRSHAEGDVDFFDYTPTGWLSGIVIGSYRGFMYPETHCFPEKKYLGYPDLYKNIYSMFKNYIILHLPYSDVRET